MNKAVIKIKLSRIHQWHQMHPYILCNTHDHVNRCLVFQTGPAVSRLVICLFRALLVYPFLGAGVVTSEKCFVTFSLRN